MPAVEFQDLEQLRQRIGQEIAVSDWLTMTQDRVDRFAEATGDHQWIHVDRERAAGSPFGGTIAHGFLTLSLIPHFLTTTIALPSARMTINYGLNRVRFTTPVPTGKRVRARFALDAIEEAKGGALDLIWKVTVELEGSDKPACVAETILRRYAG
ncbi:MAG TPA: MaoC family dehydratase [Vicinamibacteria bacterium]|nr:MaoC family dehydratase [Vicinamibacteria bacterium]